ncbi:MAG: virulence associated protein [Labilithrix sp.]|nr:virulence associated protein [Labilithrix sp.]
MRSLAGIALVSIVGVIAACGDSTETCGEGASCAPGQDGGTVDGQGSIDVPAGCDLTKAPQDSPACVADAVGVFVSASGDDAARGTKSAPVKTISAALAKAGNLPRIYVCEGTYYEAVHITRSVSVYGGFGCADFAYTGAKPTIQPSAGTDYALDVAAKNVTLSGLQIYGPEVGAPNSIAVRAINSGGLTIIDSTVESRVGANGATGALTEYTNFPSQTALNGSSAAGATGGQAHSVTCPDGTTTTGGKGADNGFNGDPGLPALGAGAGGKLGQPCNAGGGGANGADGTNTPADGATSLGALEKGVWVPGSGGAASAGTPGQGGGGGQGSQGGAGSGGGAGGCGGAGGGGGTGGGASIALLALNSEVTINGSTVASGKAGAGGTGRAGQPGEQLFGYSGSPTPFGCQGGDGGKGGDGGAGGGGAGGISVGIFFTGATPVVQNSAITSGAFGPKGKGGAPGMNDGIDGIKADTMPVP